MNAPAKTVAVSRMEAKLYILKPLLLFKNPTVGPVHLIMQGSCQLEKVVIFQRATKYVARNGSDLRP